jgi:hypothetical protein
MDGTGAAEGIERWVAEARAAEAVEARMQERWLRTQAEESSTLTGTLVGLAEAGAPVMLTAGSGRRHAGVVAMVGADFVGLRRADERVVLVSIAAVVSVEASGSARPVGADGELHSVSSGVTLRDVFARAVGDRPRLQVHCDGATLVGELVAVGLDVVTLRKDTQPPGWAYVAVASVSEASFLDSG